MRYLLDTSALSDLIKGSPKVAERLQLHGSDNTGISVVTRGEALHGVLRLPTGRRKDALSSELHRYLAYLQCESLTAEVADCYAELKVARERSGRVVDDNDLWIASTAMTLGATLVTRDSDFQGIEGLKIEDWS